MPTARSAARFLCAALVALTVSACGTELGLSRPIAPMPAEPSARPADGLLGRADLQRVVDLGLRRRGDSLAVLLSAPDAAVRARAAFALASVQDTTAGPALRLALTDSDPRVRADAAFALGQLADSTAAPALLAALAAETTADGGGDALVRREALVALGQAGTRATAIELLPFPLVAADEAARTLALARIAFRRGPDAATLAALAARLAHPEPGVTTAAALYFGRAPRAAAWSTAADHVRAALDANRRAGPSADAAVFLARALGRLADSTDAPRLARVLAEHPDWRARAAAAGALGALVGGTAAGTARAALFAGLDDAHPLVAQTAATVLGSATLAPPEVEQASAWIAAHQRDAQVAGALLPALARAGRAAEVQAWTERQRDPYARALGLTALGAASDGASLDVLFAAADDEDVILAFAALDALKARWAAVRTATDVPPTVRFYPAFARALERRDLATTSAAAPVLADSLFRPLGAPALLQRVYGQMQAPVDIEPMVEILRAVGQLRDGAERDTTVIPFLVHVAMTGHPALRMAAADALDERLIEGIDVEVTGNVAPPTPLIDWAHLAAVGARPVLTLDTDRGRVVLELDAESAPQTVQAVVRAAERGHYDGVPFHRVVPGFVVQGGDYFRRDGFGGPPVSLRSELTRRPFATGAVGVASAGKDTEGVQLFVMHAPAPHLDGRYTAFGRVVEGQDVADRLVVGDRIVRARITRVP